MSDLLPPATQASDIGKLIGDCQLREKLGEGGMGIVYRADNQKLNRTEALKIIKLSRPSDQTAFLARFRLEAQAVAALQSDNIVKIYLVGEHLGEPYFTMEFIKGVDLKKELEKCGEFPFPLRRAATLMKDIARAVHHAHERGILHRDLKPGNILLDETDKPYVTDFGLAKFVHRESKVQDSSVGQGLSHVSELTNAGYGFGTVGYTSPEQAEGEHSEVTTASDLFSLGSIFYQMITGRRAFPTADWDEFIRRARSGEFQKPSDLNPVLDADLEAICVKCLETDPTRRPGSAEALACQLEHWLKGEPLDVDWRETPLWERTRKWIQRHPVTAALSATVAASLVLGFAGITWQWRRADNLRSAAEQANVNLRLQRAEDHFANGNTHLGLATLALILRDQPSHSVAAERLWNALGRRRFLFPSTNTSSLSLQPEPRLRVRDDVHIEILNTNGIARVISNAHARVIRDLRFSPDRTRIISAGADSKARIWDAATGDAMLTIKHSQPVYHAEFSPDSQCIATASRDGSARVWSTNGEPLGVVMPHSSDVKHARFCACGRHIVTVSKDGVVRVWRATDPVGEPLTDSLRLGPEVEDAVFLHEQEILVFTGNQGSRCFRMGSVLFPRQHDDAGMNLVSIATTNYMDEPEKRSRDGHLLARRVGTSVHIVDAFTGNPKSVPLAHDAEVNSLDFSADGLRLVTSTVERVRVWDVFTGQPLTDPIPSADAPIAVVRFVEDGDYVLTSAGWRLRVARLHQPAPSWLPELAETVAQISLKADGRITKIPFQTFFALQEKLTSSPETNLHALLAKEFLK